MSEKINLKEIERKVYTSYHQDGLIDIAIALIVLAFGLMSIFDMPWMGGIFVVVGISVYAAAKKTLTVPRIGFVKLASYRVKAMQTIAVGVFSLTALLGVVAFMQFESGGTPDWLLFAIENHMLVIGVSAAVSFCAAGYTFRITRMYGYALLALVMFIAGHYLDYPLYYYIVLLGSLVLLYGLTLLIRFVRNNPPTTGSIGDRGNEEQ